MFCLWFDTLHHCTYAYGCLATNTTTHPYIKCKPESLTIYTYTPHLAEIERLLLERVWPGTLLPICSAYGNTP